MRRRQACVIVLIAGLLISSAFVFGFHLGTFHGDSNQHPPATTYEITVRDFPVHTIIDGDTFKVIYDGDLTSVRIAGIDTPERGEPGYDEATDALRELIGDKIVRLEFTEHRKRDNFGRLLCKVYPDDRDIGAEMLRLGLAEVYRRGK